MNDTWASWLLLVPLISAAVAWLLWRLGRDATWESPLDTAALATMCAGLLAEMTLAIWAEGAGLLRGVDLDLRMSPLARLGLLAANGSLLCATFFAWRFADGGISPTRGAFLWIVGGTSSLLAAALLVQDRVVASLLLLGPALVVAAGTHGYRHTDTDDGDDEARRMELAKRVAGGLKHLAVATIGTGLLIAGAVLLGRYGYSLENRGLLQLGLGLLAIGLAVRIGTMPFAPSVADLVEAAPGIAMVLLGAITPALLVAGLMLLAPAGQNATASSPVWLGAIGALLAGIRALGAAREHRVPSTEYRVRGSFSALVASTVLLQVGWALAGVLSGSPTGAAGAALLALNIAITAPLVILGSWQEQSFDSSGPGAPNNHQLPTAYWSRIGFAVGVASLLGLPPMGGFLGTLLVAQAVLAGERLWLSLLLLALALVAVAWVSALRFLGTSSAPAISHQEQTSDAPCSTHVLLAIALIAAQLALFALSWGITNYELRITN